jgi:hypothetical protein
MTGLDPRLSGFAFRANFEGPSAGRRAIPDRRLLNGKYRAVAYENVKFAVMLDSAVLDVPSITSESPSSAVIVTLPFAWVA